MKNKKLLKLLNTLGLYTKRQYLEVTDKVSGLEVQINELPYDFDILIDVYKAQQLNSLIYKAINRCYNNKELTFLLERWFLRLKGACHAKHIKID